LKAYFLTFKNIFMQETLQKKDALSFSRQNMLDYFATHDLKYIAEGAVFKNLSTGEVYKGKAEIGGMLHFMYKVAFNARLEMVNYVIEEEKASVEGIFKGDHIGEIGGIAATNKKVAVPMSVSYDLKNGLIQEARIYFMENQLMEQLGVAPGPSQKTTFLVRDIFQLKFGHYKDAKSLLDEATAQAMMPNSRNTRILTDFTGAAYRLIFEEGFENLSDYELSLTGSMATKEWHDWYERFKPHVESSFREILKQVS
jgi:predicted ester cyclase